MPNRPTVSRASVSLQKDGALRHLLQLLWDAGWDNTVFALELCEDGSLSRFLCGFQVARAGVALGAEQIPDSGVGSVVVKVESQDSRGLKVVEERFTSPEILLNRRIVPRIESLVEKLHLLD